jgi:hypothetical protein
MKYLAKVKNGNYIDIAPHHLVRHSNTFLFYLLVWKGICANPLPSLKKKYRFIRWRDKFINAGVLKSRIFLSSIYVLKNQLFHLPSPYIKELESIKEA